jgi:hypothetical protein
MACDLPNLLNSCRRFYLTLLSITVNTTARQLVSLLARHRYTIHEGAATQRVLQAARKNENNQFFSFKNSLQQTTSASSGFPANNTYNVYLKTVYI